MNLAGWAEDTACGILRAPLPRRWAHSQGVAAQARGLAPILGTHTDLVTVAAWLHDIGYAPDLIDTGFHPLDGARYLSDTQQASDMLCRLVAHHSGAMIEAEEYGLADQLAREFADALAYCDMVTGPDGQQLSVEQRLTEIRDRYGPDDPVSRALVRSAPQLTSAVMRVRHRMAKSASVPRTPPALTLALAPAT
jgi:hypothetical protein